MNGELSQLVALCSAANAAMTDSLDKGQVYPDHSVFQFCNAVRFVDIKKGLFGKFREVERHNNPDDWLRSLRDTQTIRAWLTFESADNTDAPAHQLAAFVGGGGNWQLVLATDDATDFWKSRWQVTDQNASDNRIWSVTYGCVGKSNHGSPTPVADLNGATSRLRSALTGTRDFADEHELALWSEWFQRALDCTNSSKPISFPDYVDFISLDSYPEKAQRLFAAAYHGWVFGGMGSWNDLSFEMNSENDRYHALSAELFAAINDAIQQATWSFGSNESA